MPDKQGKPLPPIRQEWYNDNRERFDAESSQVPPPPAAEDKKLSNMDKLKEELNKRHTFERLSTITIRSKTTGTIWIDHGKFVIDDGQIKEIKP